MSDNLTNEQIAQLLRKQQERKKALAEQKKSQEQAESKERAEKLAMLRQLTLENDKTEKSLRSPSKKAFEVASQSAVTSAPLIKKEVLGDINSSTQKVSAWSAAQRVLKKVVFDTSEEEDEAKSNVSELLDDRDSEPTLAFTSKHFAGESADEETDEGIESESEESIIEYMGSVSGRTASSVVSATSAASTARSELSSALALDSKRELLDILHRAGFNGASIVGEALAVELPEGSWDNDVRTRGVMLYNALSKRGAITAKLKAQVSTFMKEQAVEAAVTATNLSTLLGGYSSSSTLASMSKICVAVKECEKRMQQAVTLKPSSTTRQTLLAWATSLCEGNSKGIDWQTLVSVQSSFRPEDWSDTGVPTKQVNDLVLFSAPTGNKATHAGYDQDILARLLAHWRARIERTGDGSDRQFEPKVAITDSDTSERLALAQVWSGIWLILCLRHLRSSWRTYRKKYMPAKAYGMAEIQARLSQLEEELIQAKSRSDIDQAIEAEQAALESLVRLDPKYKQASKATIQVYFKYILSYWCRGNLWQAWTLFGRSEAAKRVGCEVAQVLKTTNHAEGFNNGLKHFHLERWRRRGKRLRLDMLVSLLIAHITPSIFSAHAFEQSYTDWTAARFGEALEAASASDNLSPKQSADTGVTLLLPDSARDAAALSMFDKWKRCLWLDITDDFTWIAWVPSESHATGHVTSRFYQVEITYEFSHHTSSCSCPDHRSHVNTFCKHMRFVLLCLTSPPYANIRSPCCPKDVGQLVANRANSLQTKAEVLLTSNFPTSLLLHSWALDYRPTGPPGMLLVPLPLSRIHNATTLSASHANFVNSAETDHADLVFDNASNSSHPSLSDSGDSDSTRSSLSSHQEIYEDCQSTYQDNESVNSTQAQIASQLMSRATYEANDTLKRLFRLRDLISGNNYSQMLEHSSAVDTRYLDTLLDDIQALSRQLRPAARPAAATSEHSVREYTAHDQLNDSGSAADAEGCEGVGKRIAAGKRRRADPDILAPDRETAQRRKESHSVH